MRLQQRGPFQQPGEKRGSDPQETRSVSSTAKGLDGLLARKCSLRGKEGQTAIACVLPAAFLNEGSALGHWKVPKSTPRQRYSTADIQPSRGTAQVGFKYDFVSGEGRSKHSLGGMAQATGLAVLPHSTAPEPGSSLAWRHPLPSSGDKESKLGGPQQGSGLPGQSRVESQPRGTACSSGGSA